MTKSIVGVFFLALLILFNGGYSQKDHLFTSIVEALSVPADSVFQLDLSKEKLDSIPPVLLSFRNLEWLSLSKMKLKDLPDDFYFPHLTYIDLSKNEFEVFPEEICHIRSLKEIHLQKNKLNALPKSIGQLTKLEKLDVWFNTITEIPDEFMNCRALRFADFRGMNYSKEFQKIWSEKMPWVKFEFDLGCDCGN